MRLRDCCQGAHAQPNQSAAEGLISLADALARSPSARSLAASKEKEELQAHSGIKGEVHAIALKACASRERCQGANHASDCC